MCCLRVIIFMGLLFVLIFLFGICRFEVGFKVIWVIIFCFDEILFKILFVLLDLKLFGVSLLWCCLLCWVIMLNLVLILMFLIVFMFIRVCVSLVFRWLKIGLFNFGIIFVVIMVILVSIELLLCRNWLIRVFICGIMFWFG